jgi:arsenite-transporting ATPase
MRVLLFTGKGGVGKTSISAATAVRCAELGYKTVIISTDAAHSLSDVFKIELSDKPLEIGRNLYGVEVDPNSEIRDNWGDIQKYITAFLKSQGIEEVVAEEIAILPGIDELMSLLKIREFYDSGNYDCIILDCAPTGATVKLLSIPDVFRWYIQKLLPIEKRVMKVIKPVAERFVPFPLPAQDVYNSIEFLYTKLDRLNKIMLDNKTTSIRLVINPERMVIKEAQRAYAYLSLFGYNVDAVFANRIFSENISNTIYFNWLKIQKKYISEAEEMFSPLPIFCVKFFEKEISGVQDLSILAEECYGSDNPLKVYHREKPVIFSRKNGVNTISIHLPGIKKEEVDLWIKGEELILKVKNFQRNILLPHNFMNMEIRSARLEKENLVITFSKKSI